MYKAGKEHASSSNKSTVLINIKIYFLYILIALQWNVDQVIASVNVINNTNTRPRKRTSVIHFSPWRFWTNLHIWITSFNLLLILVGSISQFCDFPLLRSCSQTIFCPFFRFRALQIHYFLCYPQAVDLGLS